MCEPIDALLIGLMGACIGAAAAWLMNILGDNQVPATIAVVIALALTVVILLCYVTVKMITINSI